MSTTVVSTALATGICIPAVGPSALQAGSGAGGAGLAGRQTRGASMTGLIAVRQQRDLPVVPVYDH